MLPRAPFKCSSQGEPLIEIRADDKFAKRIILVALLCGSGEICKMLLHVS